MKKYQVLLFSLFLFVANMSNVAGQQLIKVGGKVSDWSLQDADKNSFSLDSWKGKALLISYVAPQYPDLNDGLNDYITQAFINGEIKIDGFWAFGIVDCKSSKIPNSLIRTVAGRKAKKYGTTILFDYNGLLQNSWGMPKENYTTVILDKDRICRAIYVGEVPPSEYANVVKLIRQLSE